MFYIQFIFWHLVIEEHIVLTSHTDLRLHHYLSTTGWDNDSVSAFCWSVSQPSRYFVRRTAVRAFQVAFEIVPRMRRPHCPIAFPALTNYIGGKKEKKLLSLHLSAWKILKCCRDNWLSRGQHIISHWKRPFLASYWLSIWTFLLYFPFNNWEIKKR